MKTTKILLFRPGGVSIEFEDVTIDHYDKNMVEFTKRDTEKDEIMAGSYISTLPYIIAEVETEDHETGKD